MKKAPNNAAAVAPTPRTAENSKVLRSERTYTTNKKRWEVLWKAGDFRTVGQRSEQTKVAIFVDFYRFVELEPSKWLKQLLRTPAKIKGWDPKDLTLEDLQETLAKYVEETRALNVMPWDQRPRPNTQVELEEELAEAYENAAALRSLNQTQAEQLEEMRKRLEQFEAQGRAAPAVGSAQTQTGSKPPKGSGEGA